MTTNPAFVNAVNGIQMWEYGSICPVTPICIFIHPTHSLNMIKGDSFIGASQSVETLETTLK